ncbi:MAG TPA: hypothetical protein PK609_02025 [Candidatus Paceibacterota bacterium]|nr:hypothetical protein [Candidatus Paceibacterota bacterium]
MDALNSFATGGFADIIAFIGNFLVLLIIAGILFFFALRTGRSMLISFILSLYIGFALFSIFPYKEMFLIGDSPLVRAVSGIVLFGVFTAFPYVLLRRASTSGSMRIHPVTLAVLAFVAGGFVLALGYHVLNIAAVIPLTPSLDLLFAPDQYFFWWFVAPLVGIFIATR